jgi:hypothetical protein
MTDERLRQILSRCRRRLLLVAFVRHLAISWAATSTLLAAAALAWPSDLGVFYQRAAFTLLAGFAAAVVLTWVRRPSMRRTAIELDRRLALDDSFVAALDCLKASLPVASLVIRYALNRFGSAKPRDVFPVNAGVPIVVMMTAVVTALAVGAWRRPSVQVGRTDGFVIGGGSPEASAGDKSIEPSQEAGRAVRASGEASGARPEGRAYVPQHPADVPTTDSVVSRPDLEVGLQIDPHAGQQPTTSLRGKPGAGILRDAEPEHAPFSSNRSAADGGSSAALAESGNGRSAADGARGVGATAIGNPNLGGQSGGVREGSLLDEAGATQSGRHGSGAGVNRSRRTVPASPTAASAGWSNTEVPPDLRTYVLEYFSAVERQVERR